MNLTASFGLTNSLNETNALVKQLSIGLLLLYKLLTLLFYLYSQNRISIWIKI